MMPPMAIMLTWRACRLRLSPLPAGGAVAGVVAGVAAGMAASGAVMVPALPPWLACDVAPGVGVPGAGVNAELVALRPALPRNHWATRPYPLL
jgi:hypothetical protein